MRTKTRHLTWSWDKTAHIQMPPDISCHSLHPLGVPIPGPCSRKIPGGLFLLKWRVGGGEWKGGGQLSQTPTHVGVDEARTLFSKHLCSVSIPTTWRSICTTLLPCLHWDLSLGWSQTDFRRIPPYTNVSVNTQLKIFILSVSVAFRSIRVLLVSLHKSTMHLY